jgi:uncharacterized protein
MMNQKIEKPLPGIDEDNKPFWDYCKQHELRMQKCSRCGKLYYPPSAMCPHCMNMKSEWVKLSGKGKVFSFVVVRQAPSPAFAKDAPYVVAIIELEEGQRLTSNVIGCKPEDVKINMAVEVVFEDVTKDIAIPKFKPII